MTKPSEIRAALDAAAEKQPCKFFVGQDVVEVYDDGKRVIGSRVAKVGRTWVTTDRGNKYGLNGSGEYCWRLTTRSALDLRARRSRAVDAIRKVIDRPVWLVKEDESLAAEVERLEAAAKALEVTP